MSPEQIHIRDRKRVGLVPFVPPLGSRFYYLRRLLEKLGVEHSTDTVTIVPSNVIEDLPAKLGTLWDELPVAFDLPAKTSTPGDGKLRNKRSALELINKVLTAWSNSRLAPCKETRIQKKVNVKKLSFHDYRMKNAYEETLYQVGGTKYGMETLWRSETSVSFEHQNLQKGQRRSNDNHAKHPPTDAEVVIRSAIQMMVMLLRAS